MEVQIQIRREGKLNVVDVDVDISEFTAQEGERVDAVCTPAQKVPSNRYFHAMIWAKLLHTPYAGAQFDEVDINLSELAKFATTPEEVAWTADGESVVIPMETETGTVQAEVDIAQ